MVMTLRRPPPTPHKQHLALQRAAKTYRRSASLKPSWLRGLACWIVSCSWALPNQMVKRDVWCKVVGRGSMISPFKTLNIGLAYRIWKMARLNFPLEKNATA